MIAEIFTLCDHTVWLEDWSKFHNGFASILAKHDLDIEKVIYTFARQIIKNHETPILPGFALLRDIL